VKAVALLLAASVVIAAGCGGGKKSSATPGTPYATTAPAAGTTTNAAPGFTSTKNCAELLGLAAKFAQALGATGNANTTVTDQAKAFEAMANAAPSEIRTDFKLVASAFNAYAQAFVKAGIKAGQQPTQAQMAQVVAAAKAFSGPKLRAAETHLTAWGRKNCGYKP
jgi:hypothetical protein